MAQERILIVDDNATNMKLVEFVLLAQGYQIRTALDAPQALALMSTFAPDLILMDLQLPGMDGLELTRLLKASAKSREILIVAVTAYAMKGDDWKARQAGCDGYITKPIDTRTLPRLISEYLRRGARTPSKDP